MPRPASAFFRGCRALAGCAALAIGLAGAGRGAQAQDASPPALDRSRLSEAAPRAQESPQPSAERALERLRADAAASRGAGRARPAAAAWLLGLLALHGLAMPQDSARARSWFERAQQLGHPLAPAGLAWCAIDGCGGVPQPAAARPWLARLRGAAPARALYLEWLVEQKLAPLQVATPDLQGPTTPPLPRRDLLLRAAKDGDIHARMELGFESVAAGHPQEAIEHFHGAAPRSPAAAFNAALLAERAQPAAGPASDMAQAEQWFVQGRRYHQGDGVPASYSEAIRLYEMAAGKGNIRARRMLELIFSRPAPGGGVDIAWMQQLSHFDVSAFGTVTVLPPAATAALRRDPTPLYDLVPAEWRRSP
jgi:TPR repeat protein